MKRRFLTVLLAGSFCLMPRFSHAHPETGLLPDAIAEMEYRIVLEITPNDIKTRNRLGVVYYRKNRLKEAEREFSEVLRTAPNDFDAHDGMGLVKLKQNRNDDAIAWFRKAIALNGEDTTVYHSLGLALEHAGKLPEAEASYLKGVEVNERLLRQGTNREKEKERRKLLLDALQNLRARLKSAQR